MQTRGLGVVVGLCVLGGSLTAALAAPGLFPRSLMENSTGFDDTIFLGRPDDISAGLGGQIVTYDFGVARVLNRAGPDFNVYESDGGTPEFDLIEVLVSADGRTFLSVKRSEAAVVRIEGDEGHGNDAFARSYDVRVTGLTAVRFIRIDGRGTGTSGGFRGFDLEAVGAVHFAAPLCNGQKATIVGTNQSDILIGTAGKDVMVGLGGNDFMSGLGGDDVICGGAGDDVLRGSSGNDVIFGGAGHDGISGGLGNDTLNGGLGDDILLGGDGNDKLSGSAGNDFLFGEAGQDRLHGGEGTDSCDGGSETDTHLGGCETVTTIP